MKSLSKIISESINYYVNYSHLKEGDFLQFFIKIKGNEMKK